MKKILIQALFILPFFMLSGILLSGVSNGFKALIQFVGIFIIIAITDTLIDKYRERDAK